ncbi:TetR/AcrR family transcriptional regulator [Demequina sp. NBRC 110056]|uniref:TetR/AcrR family transcriptional regulator n=1 Tax=Demequina sp. NBRC 110056 TaxID=1570345 RepID=UPI00135634E5|nr:TetR/AcrR family transcriptional regulator [Demequina sp. NBRC 110056]
MTPQPQQRRRRSHELDDAIKAAVLEEMAERGYQGLTYEGVARRVGTSKPVLYRRYSSRADMAIDAFLTSRIGSPPANFAGPLREDLIALVSGVLNRVGPEGVQIFRGVIGEVDDGTVARVAGLVTVQFSGWLDEILERARVAGEIPDRPVSPVVVRAIIGLVRNEVLFTLGAGQDGDIPALVDEVMVPLLRA